MMRMFGLLSLVALAGGCAHTKHAEAAPQAAHGQAIQVVQLKYAVADDLGKELMQTLGRNGGLRVVADARTNSLILTGESEADLAGALDLISKLDVEAPQKH